MDITYIYHSGFAIEGEGYTLIIDYYRDTELAHPTSEGWTNYVQEVLLHKPGKLYVLSSHFHPDHFNPEILEWKKQRPDIVYILSKDILRHRRASRYATDNWLSKGDEYTDSLLHVKAYGSTDTGVSFYIEIEGMRLFHAGDLNNWHWMDESTPEEWHKAENWYLRELADIKKEVDKVDVAFFPIDARLGKEYMRGATQFVENIQTKLFVPMHFTFSSAEQADCFAPIAQAHRCLFFPIHAEGDSIILE